MKKLSKSFALLIAAGSLSVAAQQSAPDRTFTPTEIQGEEHDGLKPMFTVAHYPSGWSLQIDFVAELPVKARAWLKPTNRVCSILELSLTNGATIPPLSSDSALAGRLPAEATVSSIMQGLPREGRYMQWLWEVGRDQIAGFASFRLDNHFNVSTNDFILRITPLLYKVDTNETTAHLVKFTPTTLELRPDGKVRALPSP